MCHVREIRNLPLLSCFVSVKHPVNVFVPAIVNCREDLIEDVTADKLTSSSVYAIGYAPDRARLTTLYGDDGTGGQGAWSSRTIDFDQYIQVGWSVT